MKTVKHGSEVRRESDADAEVLVKKGWSYCPKSTWKSKKHPAPAPKAEITAVSEGTEEVAKKPKKRPNKPRTPRNARNE